MWYLIPILSVVITAMWVVTVFAIKTEIFTGTVQIIVKVNKFQTHNVSLLAATIKWDWLLVPNSTWIISFLHNGWLKEHFNWQVSGIQVVTIL